ncbi:MAG: ceramidase domain-containing protein, partial [Methylosarcina sp.]
MTFDRRLTLILLLTVAAVIALFSVDPMAQDPNYHRFADQRTKYGVANFYNVISNLPFVVIGYMGMRLVVTDKSK